MVAVADSVAGMDFVSGAGSMAVPFSTVRADSMAAVDYMAITGREGTFDMPLYS
jgi:hypothetical protein